MPRYIDADALKDVIQQHDYPLADKLNSVDNGMFTLGIFQAIDEQPTVSTDEVRGVGKWEKDSDGLDVCSECGEVALQRVFIKLPDKIVDLQMVRSKFCPSCGARMGGVQDALS